ncbi:MAG: ATP-binding protein [Succinivibrio sp.]|nr:ATP-binding protein [Succinivibrio sp.]
MARKDNSDVQADKNIAALGRKLRLTPMVEAFNKLRGDPKFDNCSYTYREVFTKLLKEMEDQRDGARTERSLVKLNLDNPGASLDNMFFTQRKGLTKQQAAELAECHWITDKRIVMLTAKSGTGKTWIADCLAICAVTSGFKVYFNRMSQLIRELDVMDGADFAEFLRRMKKNDLIYIDNLGQGELSKTTAQYVYDLLDACANKHCAFLFTTQKTVKFWYDYLSDPELADSFVDRIMCGTSIQIKLEGPSFRRVAAPESASGELTKNGKQSDQKKDSDLAESAQGSEMVENGKLVSLPSDGKHGNLPKNGKQPDNGGEAENE